MKKFLKRCWEWLKTSNRGKHLGCGALVGFGADDVYCATYTGIIVSSALEFKDHAWGGKADIIDWTLTIVGVMIGFGIRIVTIG